MWGVRSGYVAKRDCRRLRWTEDLSLDLGAGLMLEMDRMDRLALAAGELGEVGGDRRLGGSYSFLNMAAACLMIWTSDFVYLCGSGDSSDGGSGNGGRAVVSPGLGLRTEVPRDDGGVVAFVEGQLDRGTNCIARQISQFFHFTAILAHAEGRGASEFGSFSLDWPLRLVTMYK